MTQTQDLDALIEEARSDKHTRPIDPKATYRTKSVAFFDDVINAITALEATGEPVAWRARDEDDRQWVHVGHNPRTPFKICEPLYLHPAPSVPAWQPIETAPDGMVIDVWYAPVKTIPCRVPNAHRDGDRWYDGTGNRMWHTPTHWMPLPPAPEVKP